MVQWREKLKNDATMYFRNSHKRKVGFGCAWSKAEAVDERELRVYHRTMNENDESN